MEDSAIVLHTFREVSTIQTANITASKRHWKYVRINIISQLYTFLTVQYKFKKILTYNTKQSDRAFFTSVLRRALRRSLLKTRFASDFLTNQ